VELLPQMAQILYFQPLLLLVVVAAVLDQLDQTLTEPQAALAAVQFLITLALLALVIPLQPHPHKEIMAVATGAL
jgi:hypothetical protein